MAKLQYFLIITDLSEALVPTLRVGMQTGRSAFVYNNKAQFKPMSAMLFRFQLHPSRDIKGRGAS